MPEYTTGEMAKLCDTTVRTVQYYDRRNILAPSKLTDGGRRLYTDEDLHKLRIICFLRSLDLSIDNIGKILSEENSYRVIELLLEQQIQSLKSDISALSAKVHTAEQLQRELKGLGSFSVNSIQDIAYKMKNNRKLKRLRWYTLAVGFVMDVIEVVTVYYGFVRHNWLPFFIGLPVLIFLGIYISRYYFKNVAYICPDCHHIFQPKMKEAFWAYHTPKTRRLTCPECKEKSDCIETYYVEE